MTQGTVRHGASGLRAPAVLALVVALGLVTGCSDTDPAPEPTPSPTVAPTTTAQPDPEPDPAADLPQEPEAPEPRSGTPDEHDAEAAARYFLELHEYAMATGDTATWQRRSDPGCAFCTNALDEMTMAAEPGAVQHGGAAEFGEPALAGYDPDLGLFAVEVPYSTDAVELIGADGVTRYEYAAGDGYMILDVGYLPGTGWTLFTGVHRDESVR